MAQGMLQFPPRPPSATHAEMLSLQPQCVICRKAILLHVDRRKHVWMLLDAGSARVLEIPKVFLNFDIPLPLPVQERQMMVHCTYFLCPKSCCCPCCCCGFCCRCWCLYMHLCSMYYIFIYHRYIIYSSPQVPTQAQDHYGWHRGSGESGSSVDVLSLVR